MKNIKLFEEFNTDNIQKVLDDNYLAYKDNFVKVHKILHGVNQGKIRFIIFDDKKDEFIRYSMLFGAAKLLDTEYSDNTKIRNITIDPNPRFRKVSLITTEAIINLFFKKHDLHVFKELDSEFVRNEETKYKDDIQEVANNAKNLGDIFDGLRDIRNNFEKSHKELIDEHKLKTDTNKYNI